jgi:hypothetical protein
VSGVDARQQKHWPGLLFQERALKAELKVAHRTLPGGKELLERQKECGQSVQSAHNAEK